MDNYNQMMDSEYANIVYQTPVDMPIDGLLLSNNQEESVEKEQQQQQQFTSLVDNSVAMSGTSALTTPDTEEPLTSTIEPTIAADNILTDQILRETTGGAEEKIIANEEEPTENQEPLTSDSPPTDNGVIENTTAEASLISDLENASCIPVAETNVDIKPVTNEVDVPITVENEIVSSTEKPFESGDAQIITNSEVDDAVNEDETNQDISEENNFDEEETEKLVAPDESDNLIVPDVDIDAIIVNQEEEIDVNQCRICLSTDDLVDIFRFDEKTSLRICDLIMKLCSTVRISERDYLPHFVCALCADRVSTAFELRIQCEQTDKLLRSKLKRSKKKARGPTEFVMIDCAEFSSGSEDDKNKDDDEFHLSEVTLPSEADSDISIEEKKRAQPKRNRRKTARAPPKRKSSSPRSSSNKKSRNSVVYIEAAVSDDDDNVSNSRPGRRSRLKTKTTYSSYESEEDVPISRKTTASKKNVHKCNLCVKVFKSASGLREHKRVHVEEKPVICSICNKSFKLPAHLNAHMRVHKEENERKCAQCKEYFSSKTELKKHIQTVHTFACEKCKRVFTMKSRLDRHKEGKCDGDTKHRKPEYEYSGCSGRDLFKSVAPLTTTYWSDSFSE